MTLAKTDFPQSLVPEKYDAVTCTYDSAGNMLSVSYYRGGVAGILLAVVTMTYDASNNMLTAERG